MSVESKRRLERLYDRSRMLAAARAFFYERKITEVDCPIISPKASVDAHIDLIPCVVRGKGTCWLHSSPEYGMKRLLAEGIRDIFQLSHVFRDGEEGQKHRPEFMMAEWYRIDLSYEEMIEEACQFIELFVGRQQRLVLTYQEIFLKYVNIDPLYCTVADFLAYIAAKGARFPYDPEVDTIDDLLSFVLTTFIEPELASIDDALVVITYFPASQSALAKTQQRVAERFEVYYQGIELSNGYHELQDAVEQHKRLHEANAERRKRKKEELPIDEAFLQALGRGIPDCCGVAVGFDRLMMLRHSVTDIGDVLPLP